MNNTAIKTLRENFIKRHHLNSDFFTPSEHFEPEVHFTDTALLKDKYFHIKNSPIYSSPSIKMPYKHHRPSLSEHNIHYNPHKIFNPESKVLHIVHHSESLQPPFVKTDKLKKSVTSRIALSVPKYTSFLMKPCSVRTVKIGSRPQSAFTVTKNQFHQASRIRSSKKEQKIRKRSDILKPWEVDDEELSSPKI